MPNDACDFLTRKPKPHDCGRYYHCQSQVQTRPSTNTESHQTTLFNVLFPNPRGQFIFPQHCKTKPSTMGKGKKKENKDAQLQHLLSTHRHVFVLDVGRQPERNRSHLRLRISAFGGALFIGKNSHMKRIITKHTTSALVDLVTYIYGETALLCFSEAWETIYEMLMSEYNLPPRAAFLEGSYGLLTGIELQEYWGFRTNIPSDLLLHHEGDTGSHASGAASDLSTRHEFVSNTGELNVVPEDLSTIEFIPAGEDTNVWAEFVPDGAESDVLVHEIWLNDGPTA